MSNVVSLRAFKALRDTDAEELAYRARILSMSKVELLEEMVRFQEERKQLGVLTPVLMQMQTMKVILMKERTGLKEYFS